MAEGLQLGRYSVFAELASGGMATVYLGRMQGPVGFGRTVAIKRLHPHLARDPDFVSMFLDEARLAARIAHPNVVPTLDVVKTDRELFLVLEYVKGETLSALMRAAAGRGERVPVPIAVSILVDVLSGLHAAHEAHDEQGVPLEIVHRDVSPQNVIVGADGVTRLLDFGVAKAASRLQTTLEGQIKGKIAYMAPEQVSGQATRRSDLYAAGVVLWEILALRRLFTGANEAQLLQAVLAPAVAPPSLDNPDVTPELDAIVLRALSPDPEGRFATALEMAEALHASARPASSHQVSAWVQSMVGDSLLARSALVAECESHSGNTGRSEVKKLFVKDPLHDLTVEVASETRAAPPADAVGAPHPSGASVVTASVSLPVAAVAPSRAPWRAVVGVAVVAALGAIALLATRGTERVAAPASPLAQAASPAAPAASPGPPAAADPAPSAPPAAAAPDPSAPPAAPSARARKPAPAAPGKPRVAAPASSAAGDINTLLDSH